jgi:hypothetical protein
MNECRYDERLKLRWGIYTPRIHWITRGTGTPKDKDEVNRREVCERNGWVCVLEVIDTPSRLRLTRKSAALARMLPTLDLSCAETAARRKSKSPLVECASWTLETAKKRSVSQWAGKNKSRALRPNPLESLKICWLIIRNWIIPVGPIFSLHPAMV